MSVWSMVSFRSFSASASSFFLISGAARRAPCSRASRSSYHIFHIFHNLLHFPHFSTFSFFYNSQFFIFPDFPSFSMKKLKIRDDGRFDQGFFYSVGVIIQWSGVRGGSPTRDYVPIKISPFYIAGTEGKIRVPNFIFLQFGSPTLLGSPTLSSQHRPSVAPVSPQD